MDSTERVILDSIAVRVDLPQLARRLRVGEDSADYRDLRALVVEAEQRARPKALYRVAYIHERGDDHVVLDGIQLRSRVLRVNLEGAHRAFAYVATCGTELDAWAREIDDVLWQYWADAVKEAALGAANRALRQDIDTRLQPGKTSTMAPGSLPDWPISQQRPLFELLGDVEEAIGVRLTPSMLMVPNKSISGIRFPAEVDFVSCALCPREVCPGRRAPYDAGLHARRYA